MLSIHSHGVFFSPPAEVSMAEMPIFQCFAELGPYSAYLLQHPHLSFLDAALGD